MKAAEPVTVALTLLGFLVPTASATIKIEEAVVGPTNAGGLYVVSQNEARVAYIGAKGTRTVVSVDGVEGPVLDELIGGSGISMSGPMQIHNANAGGKFNGTPSAVIFSETGAHYAYIGRQGNEYVVVHDGKEIGRGPRSALALQHNPLGLSPHGKHAFWGEMKTEGGRGTFRLIMDGKPGPWAGHQDLKPVFSPDDSRYVYLAGTVDDYKKPMLIVDGKVASYVGSQPQFTVDNKLLLTTTDLKGVWVDGRPMSINAYIGVEKVTPAPVGGRFAVIVRKKNVNHQGVGTLYLDGKEVPGTEGAMDIAFSPDGKRYALRCANHEARSFFVMIDGKKGTEYQSVTDKFYWSPDSSKVAYQISSSGRNFVVVNTEEFPVEMVHALMRAPIRFAAHGGRYAFSSNDGSNRNFLTIVDGKQVLPSGVYPDGQSFEFSDNGARYAVAVGQIGRQGMTAILDNGKLNDALAPGSFINFSSAQFSNDYHNLNFALSPDGKYLARIARTPQNANAGLYVNDKLVFPNTQIWYPTFTPDGKHLFWLAAERRADNKSGRDYVVYVDGEPAVRLTAEQMISTRGAWRTGRDGVVTCLGVVGDTVKRLRITASPDMDIDKMIARAEKAQAGAVAEAVAAKKKVDDDALAAKQKAEAEAAKAKAEQQARADAANKARLDALEAAKKKRLLQLENAKRKRQGLPPLTELPQSR